MRRRGPRGFCQGDRRSVAPGACGLRTSARTLKNIRGKYDENTCTRRSGSLLYGDSHLRGSGGQGRLSPFVSETGALCPRSQHNPFLSLRGASRVYWFLLALVSNSQKDVSRSTRVILVAQPRDSLGSILARRCSPQRKAWTRQGLTLQF